MKSILPPLLCFSVAGFLHAAEPAAAPVTSPGATPSSRPNVLFIAVDDLRPELGCYGKDYIKSPNIDALARSGVVFERAYVQQAVCSPSRTSVMTGTRPDTSKVWDLKTHFRVALPDVVTLQQNFKNNGYFVQGMGKLFHGAYDDAPSWSVPWQTPKAETFVRPENIALHQRQNNLAPASGPETLSPAAVALRKDDTFTSRFNVRGPAFEGEDVPDNTFTAGKVADLAVKTLGELSKKGTPFFLGVGFVKPHLPFVSPKKYWDLYDPSKIELAPNPYLPKGAPDYAILSGAEMRAYEGIPMGDIPPALARQLIHGYYASVSYMDAQLGKVLAELDRLDLRKNTIIILWGDHGWKLGEHNAWCKHSTTENDTNAPLILSAPGMVAPGLRTRALVEFVDIYPTLSALAGLPLPAHLEGISLKPLLDNPQRPWKTAAFSQYPRIKDKEKIMGYSMRTDRHRFTVWVNREDSSQVKAVELYDQVTDPQENSNIAQDPANAGLVMTLMDQWKKGWRGALPPQS